MYDQMTEQFLDENTRHPATNLSGQVVWNTRYYLESLLTAYQATHNRKYIAAFESSALWVMNMTQTLAMLDVPDPSAPGQTATVPLRTVTGWPTNMGMLGQSIAVPTSGGAVSFYAQSLYPRNLIGPTDVVVSTRADGSLQLAWSRAGKNLQAFTLRSNADLDAIASLPLVSGQTPARLKPTGLGLPAPGSYAMGTPLVSSWHGEHTGGILIPLAHFLVMNKDEPGLVNQETAKAWQSKIVSIAAEYEDHFVPDGAGGLLFHNARWMPSAFADVDTSADYVYAEATFRILLYELTSDAHQLDLARGLISHQVSKHWATNSQGWLLLKEWPCFKSWTSRAQAPPGSIWDSFTYNPATAEITQATVFLTELFRVAQDYQVSAAVGLTDDLRQSHRTGFQGFIRVTSADPSRDPLVRFAYPLESASSSDPVIPSPDPFTLTGFVYSETSDTSFVPIAWQAMLARGQNPQKDPIGYFLLAWARTESENLAQSATGN